MRAKKVIKPAYRLSEAMGIALWCEDEAAPLQTVPDATQFPD